MDIETHPFPSSSFVLELRINQPLLPSFHSPPNHHETESKFSLTEDVPDNPAIHPRFFPASDHSTDKAYNVSTPINLKSSIGIQHDGNNNMLNSMQRKLPSFWSLFS
jgi:hypothetical protein